MAYQHSLPFVIFNFGFEMLFLLRSRLQSLNISESKIMRIMTDMGNTMLSSTFVDELFRPQDIYSDESLRNLYLSIINSSIIQLDEKSVQKLFELVTLGVKHQLITATHPCALVDITLNHMDGLKALAPACEELLKLAKERLEKLVDQLNVGDISMIRQRILNYCNGYRIRGSVFLSKGFQNEDGSFNIPPLTQLPPAEGVEAPGTIRIHSVNPPLQVRFSHPGSALLPPEGFKSGQWKPFGSVRCTRNGENQYSEESSPNCTARESTKPEEKSIPREFPNIPLLNPEELSSLSKIVCARAAAVKAERFHVDVFSDMLDVTAVPRVQMKDSRIDS